MKERILIIDDEIMNRTIVEEYLSNFGFEVYQAGTSDEGIEMMAELLPDLVLLDINMPGKDGFQALQEIKSKPETAKIPVVILSAYDRSNLKVKGLELGAEDYITRPFDSAELLARIRAALRRCRCGKPGRVLEGDFADMNLIELLQTFEVGKKTGVLTLKKLDGELVIEDGVLVFARLGNFRGREALNRIILLEEGEFTVKFNKIPAGIEKTSIGITGALMNSTAYIDEVKSMINTFKPGARVKITPAIQALRGAGKFREKTVVPLINLIIALEGDLKEMVKTLMGLVENKTLQLIDNN
jgi:DNA-binding response OmpR family regulator